MEPLLCNTREFPLLTSLPFLFSLSLSLSLSLPPLSLSLSLSLPPIQTTVLCVVKEIDEDGGEGGEREGGEDRRKREVVLLYCTSCLPVGVALVCCVCLLTEYCVSAY